MIAEALIVTGAAVALGIVGLALRFARLTLHPERETTERAKALADLEDAIRRGSANAFNAVLVTRGHLLAPDVVARARAMRWG